VSDSPCHHYAIHGSKLTWSRARVIDLVDRLVRELVQPATTEVTKDTKVDAPRYKTFLFGSCGLEVHSSRSDMDIVVVTPRVIERQDFFIRIQALLSEDPNVSEATVSDLQSLDAHREADNDPGG
jgi:poly(A) polymerase Pap1